MKVIFLGMKNIHVGTLEKKENENCYSLIKIRNGLCMLLVIIND